MVSTMNLLLNGNTSKNQTEVKIMFENYKVFETTLAGRPLKIETGKMAQLANGAARANADSVLSEVFIG